MAPAGQAATHQGVSQWKQDINTWDTLGIPSTTLGPSGTIWQSRRTGRKGFIAFTLDFAAVAANTFLSVLKQVIVAHNLSPLEMGFR